MGEPHKFKEKMEVTYEQYFQTRFKGMVEMAKEMERELGREKMLEIVGRASDRSAIESFKKQLKGRNPIESFDDFALLSEALAVSLLYSQATTMSMERKTENSIAFNVTECLWAKTFKDMNEEELGYFICCRPDFAMAEACHQKLRLQRTKTLMQGDDCCNHIWSWED